VGPEQVPSSPPDAAVSPHQGRFLLLEDDPSVARPLSRVVEMHRRAVVAATIADAKAMFGQEQFSAVILDENLPDGSGLSWLAELREQGWFGPVLMLTGKFARDVANRAQALDAQCVFKPAEPDNITLFIEHVVEREKAIAERLESAIKSLVDTHKCTRRETDALRAACSGVPRADLHKILGVTENTAKTQVRSLLKRVKEKSIDDVVQRVLRQVLADIPRRR
jgi:DNA-binding NarL/FixJ family response regulator